MPPLTSEVKSILLKHTAANRDHLGLQALQTPTAYLNTSALVIKGLLPRRRDHFGLSMHNYLDFIDYNLFEQHRRVFLLKNNLLNLLAHISTGTLELLTQTRWALELFSRPPSSHLQAIVCLFAWFYFFHFEDKTGFVAFASIASAVLYLF